jgi:TonB family protein
MIIGAFSILYWERTCPLPIHFMEVSVVEEFGLSRFFPDTLHHNGKNTLSVKKESRKQIAPKSPFSSQSSTESVVLNSQNNGDERESHDFDMTVNLTKSQLADDEGINVVSDKGNDSYRSHYIQQGRYYSGEFEGIHASQGATLSSLNISQQDFRGNNSYRAIRTLLEKAKNYPLLARKKGMEGTVFVSFMIDKKGLPQDVKIMKSSGYQVLDEEVRKMLEKASPFPEFNGEINIPITFKLTDSISNR